MENTGMHVALCFRLNLTCLNHKNNNHTCHIINILESAFYKE